MKKIFIKLLSLFAVVLLLNGCSEAEPILYSGPTFVSFTDGTMGDYFVQSDNTPFNVQVGLPAPSGSNQTFDVTLVYASGTAGTHYDLPATVSVPSGAVTANIEVGGFFENMTGRKDTLVFALTGSGVANFDNEYTLYLQQFCPFVLEDFVGAWTASEVSAYDGALPDYTVNFVAGDDGNTLVTSDLWGLGIPVNVVVDVSNPASFIFTIPDQYLWTHATYGDVFIAGIAEGPFSSCDLTMGPIEYKIYVPGLGNFDYIELNLTKD